MSVTECYQHKIVDKSNLNSFSLSLASALHQSANSTILIASALVLKFSAFLFQTFAQLKTTSIYTLALSSYSFLYQLFLEKKSPLHTITKVSRTVESFRMFERSMEKFEDV